MRDNDFNLETILGIFLNSFSEVINLHAPLRTLTRKELHLSTKPWISKSVLKSIQKRMQCLGIAIKKNDKVLIEKYKKYSNILTSIKRLAKQNYFTTMIETNKNISKQWKPINLVLQRYRKQTSTIDKLVTNDDTILTDCKDICNELNDFFVNVGPNLASKISKNGTFSRKDIVNCISSNPNSFFVNFALSMKLFKI